MERHQSLTETLKQHQEQAYQYLIQGNYSQAATLYEQAIAAEPEVKSHCWYLGLALLLDGQISEAQMTWLIGMLEGELEQVEQWNAELEQVLENEALRQELLEQNAITLLLRRQIQEIFPTNLNNSLRLIELAVKLDTCTGEELTEIAEKLAVAEPETVDFDQLMQTLECLLHYASLHATSLEFTQACLAQIHNQAQLAKFLKILVPVAVDVGHFKREPLIAAQFLELGLRVSVNNPELLTHLAGFYQNADYFEEGIETAKLLFSLYQELPDRIYASKLLLRGLMCAGGYWEEACAAFQEQELMLESLCAEQPRNLDSSRVSRLLNAFFFAPYFRDEPQKNRRIQNELAQLCQANTEIYAKEILERFHIGNRQRQSLLSSQKKPLRIGYLSHCLKAHSVGWLARWLFQYHNCEQFQIYAYLVTSADSQEPLQDWYINQVYQAYKSNKPHELAEQIYQDEIDILVDLDSITFDASYSVVKQKPAPIQVTWLGWDASGIPAIDYFIADPYVLPKSAEEYYREKIWRLPQTYLAVDGFEVGVPTLRRDELEIASDAVVYLSGQSGFKRHPDTLRLQMRIIKAVPNSYFLIKGSSNFAALEAYSTKIAQEEGVERDRLRFLPLVVSEPIHRANLGIADVVLDTYPYNGATTTMETLWMGVPLVTRVGEQFAARNSYTMMINAGITEGIAWTDEEYVEWGVRLGKDAVLRQQIAWKLRQSRQTAPLWNARQFTQEMEKAYQQMWAIYLAGVN